MGGLGNIGWVQLLILLLIVLLIFGTKRMRNIGRDLGGAIRDFRKGVSESENEDAGEPAQNAKSDQTVAGQPDKTH